MTRRTVLLALALGLGALTGCLAFSEDGAYACNPSTGEDCSGQLTAGDVVVVGGRFEPVAAEIAGSGYAVVDGSLVGPVQVCTVTGSAPSTVTTCVSGGISP